MRFKVDIVNNVVYLRLNEAEIVESEVVEPGVILDYDENGRVVGIEILALVRGRHTASITVRDNKNCSR